MKRMKGNKSIVFVLILSMVVSLALPGCGIIKVDNTSDAIESVQDNTSAQNDDNKELAEQETKEQAEKEKNSFSMMYYLAITAEEIRTSKDNRLILDDIYTALLNDINPGAIDEITQDYLNNLRDTIKSYLSISTKRERLQYIYNQDKAAAMRSAVPDPLSILSSIIPFDSSTDSCD